jgi:hypothetical protein
MSEWRIAAWSREAGRGLVSSPHFQGVPFDAAYAEVDDFILGELVHVETERVSTGLRITRIRPDMPRFVPEPGLRRANDLDESWRRHAEEVLAKRKNYMDYRIASVTSEALCIQGDDDSFCYGHSDEFNVADPVYVDLPLRFNIKALRLSQPAERDYRAARKVDELLPEHIALTIISDDNRFYFVVGGKLSHHDGFKRER